MSVLDDHVRRYIALRRAVGYRAVYEHWLVEFAGQLDAAGEPTVTVAAALAWAQQASSTDSAAGHRLAAVRGFARYLQAFDPAAEVPPRAACPVDLSRRAPYIYTPAEIGALIAAANTLEPSMWGSTMATLIGLMAATGIRPGEAYRLGRDDADLVEGVLRLVDSKFGRSRQIPLHPTTVTALGHYTAVRDAAIVHPGADTFFLTPTGRAVRSPHASPAFRAARIAAGITSPLGGRARLGDLRHTFAVTTLLEWHRDNLDVQRRLPLLSAYLGHLNPACTYWYLEATPELMGVVAARLDRAGEDQR